MDGVLADWAGFAGGVFDLEANLEDNGPAASYWSSLFSEGSRSGTSPFIDLPLARLMFDRTTASAGSVLGSDSDLATTWFEVDLAPFDADSNSETVQLNDELSTDESVLFNVISTPRVSRFSRSLEQIFNMTSWPEAEAEAIVQALTDVPYSPQLLAYDVGQGSAVALIDTGGWPRLYVDAGAGIYPNAHTTPRGLRFCSCEHPTVILTHWDADHWNGVAHDPGLLQSVWIAPRQNISTYQSRLADNIIHSGGSVLIVSSPFYISVEMHHGEHWSLPRRQPQSLEIASCTGTDLNNSGLAVSVSDHERELRWLITGDADYASLPTFANTYDTAAVVVPHHGAEQRTPIAAPSPPPGSYTRALYSFGTSNKYDHPRLASTTLHLQAGYMHDPQPLTGKLGSASGRHVLATSVRPYGAGFAIAAGWRQSPYIPAHLQHCLAPFRVGR